MVKIKFVYAYDPIAGRRAVYFIKKDYAISLLTGYKVKLGELNENKKR